MSVNLTATCPIKSAPEDAVLALLAGGDAALVQPPNSEAEAQLLQPFSSRKVSPSDDRLLTAATVAKVLGVSKERVYELSREGDLPTVRLGKRTLRWRRAALDAWVEGRESS